MGSTGTAAAAAIFLALTLPASAQTPPSSSPAPAAAPAPAARPADVASVDAIVAAAYAVISGDAGAARDWDRFRSLFHPTARMVATVRTPDGAARVRVLTPEDYIARSGPILTRDGFHEREIARTVETYGQIAHVFSTYDGRRKTSDPAPLVRGVNSFQLLHDGSRWWVLNLAWTQESAAQPLPARYLPPAR